MSSFGTVIQQGKFTSTGATKTLRIRSDVDRMTVYNMTQADATNDVGVRFYWQRGMGNGAAIMDYKQNGDDSLALTTLTTTGFYLIDTSTSEFGAPIAITSSSNAVQPSFLVASTAALATGDKVRIAGMTGQTNLNGLEFEIEVVDATHFRPRYALATAPGVVGAGGYYYVRQYDNPFVPINYVIFNVTSASNAVIRLNRQPVNSEIAEGDVIRVWFPDIAFGAYQNVSGYTAKVLSVSGSSLTTDLDTSSIAAFSYPLPANVPFSNAMVTLVGSSASSTSNSVIYNNDGFLGMRLTGGADCPGGANGDVMYWVAESVFSVNNE